jgi:hypothetical protein
MSLQQLRLILNTEHQSGTVRPAKILIVCLLTTASVVCPFHALSDHVPETMSQDLNPNYVGCLMAVDDAESEFRDALQSTCLSRMGDICSGRHGSAPPAQIIDCLYFEKQRAVAFLTNVSIDLPIQTEKEGFFGHGYQRRRSALLKDIENLAKQGRPEHVDAAIQQTVTMAMTVSTLFWLARETGTPLESHVNSIPRDH